MDKEAVLRIHCQLLSHTHTHTNFTHISYFTTLAVNQTMYHSVE